MRFFSADMMTENGIFDYRNIREDNGTTFFGSKGWISLDKYGWDEKWVDGYPELLLKFKNEDLLDKVLISQDAGFFDP